MKNYLWVYKDKFGGINNYSDLNNIYFVILLNKNFVKNILKSTYH